MMARGSETAGGHEKSSASCARPLLFLTRKYALANDMWLGRWDPLFREANLSHQMLLALARVVSTKVVLRTEGNKTLKEEGQSWDYLFHQAGMIGSAIIFPNADCKTALVYFPPKSVSETFAVAFVASV